MSFAQPAAPTSDVKVADYVGHLLLIYPRELRTGILTVNGTADAINADVVILTDPSGPRAESGVLIFQKVLIGTLKSSIGGDAVLGRLARGPAQTGKSAPYILDQFADVDAAYATSYLQSVGGDPFPQARAFTAPAPAPAPVPVQQAPVAPLPVPVAVPVAAPVAVAAPIPVPVAVPVQQAPVPVAAPAPAGPLISLPNGQQVNAEQFAMMQALGMTELPATAPPVAQPTA